MRDFAQYVLRVAAVGNAPGYAAVPVRQIDKTTWEADAPYRFEYDIVVDSAGPFGAQFDSSHAFLNLAEVLMYPAADRNQLAVRVEFCGIPTGWRIATVLSLAPKDSGCPTYVARNYDELVDSPVEIGNFQQTDFDEGGAHYSVVVHADPADYNPSHLTEIARKLVVTEVEWMQDRPFDRYIFIYHFPRRPAGGGMEHAYSTAIDATAERVKKNVAAVASVTAHEFFHLWNVKRIRPRSLEPVDYTREQYSRALWFSEGVTSTVGGYMMVRAGFWDEKRYLESLSDGIRELEARPAHLFQSVEESSLDTWLDKYSFYTQPERSISYYNKGELVGVLLDLAIRDATGGRKSLRDLFYWMNVNYAKAGKFFPDSLGVQQAAEAVAGADFQQFFADYVAGVAPLPYDRYLGTVGLRVDKRKRLVADAGFRATRGVVAAVTPGSPAETAGVRPGDAVQQINGKAPAGPLEFALAALRPGDTVRLKLSGPRGTRKVAYKLGSREEDEYTLVDLPGATPAQSARRSAWIHGQSQ